MPRKSVKKTLMSAIARTTGVKVEVPKKDRFIEDLFVRSENNLKRKPDDDDATEDEVEDVDDNLPIVLAVRFEAMEKKIAKLEADNAVLMQVNHEYSQEFERIDRNWKERAQNVQGLSNISNHLRQDVDLITSRLVIMERANPLALDMAVTALTKRVASLEAAPKPDTVSPPPPPFDSSPIEQRLTKAYEMAKRAILWHQANEAAAHNTRKEMTKGLRADLGLPTEDK